MFHMSFDAPDAPLTPPLPEETLLPCLLLGEGEKFTKGVEDLMQDAELFDEEAELLAGSWSRSPGPSG